MKKNLLYLLIIMLFAVAVSCIKSGSQDSPQNISPEKDQGQAVNSGASNSTGENDTQKNPGNEEDYLPSLNLPEVELLTPTEGVGVKPLFEWQAVDGAAWYGLSLRTSTGETYWAWMGPQTSIFLGGVSDQPRENSAGPVLEDGMQWAVVAYDSQDQIIAASSLRPISP